MSLFDAERWKTSADTDDGARLKMIEPLMWSRRLDGLNREEVVELLGPPRDTPYFNEWDFVYLLGPERGLFSLDSEWLVIDFTDADIVEKYAVVSD